MSYEVVRSRYMRISAFDAHAANSVFAEMRAEALAVVQSATTVTDLVETRRAYMRYQGQGYEIAVAAPGGDLREAPRHGKAPDAGPRRERLGRDHLAHAHGPADRARI